MNDIVLRVLQINDAINQNIKSIYRLKRLPIKKSRYYVITLKKNKEKTIFERVSDFHNLLNIIKLPNEKLITKDRCFYLIGENYELVYCLEFYYKSPEKIGYIENIIPQVEFLHRMGTDLALDRCNWDKEKRNYVNIKMEDINLIKSFPNIYDRFVFVVKNMKKK